MSKWLLIVTMGVAFAGAALAPACAGQNGLSETSYPEGFSLRQPKDWTARVDSEVILVASPDKAPVPALLLVRPFFLKDAVSAETWVRRNMETLKEYLPDVSVVKTQRLRERPDETAALIGFQKNGVAYTGLALCSIDGRSGIVYVAAAETSSFEKAKPTLQAMLESFKFGRPASAPPAPAKPKVSFAVFQDPVEGAFSVQVPRDWQVQGGTARRAATDLVHHVQAVSPDQKAWIQYNDPNIPMFVLPSQALAWAGFPEGTMYSPGYGVSGLVNRYLPGEVFLKDYLLRNLAPKVGRFEIVNLQAQPEAVAEFNRIYSEFMNMGVQLTLNAGEAAFQYERNGEPFVGYGTALTQVAYMPSTQGGNWMVAALAIYACPKREVESVQDLASRMFQSFQMNPVWVARQQQTNANVTRIVAETGQEISRIISDAYWTRQGVMDNVHRRFSNATLGVTDVRNPETGETWKVESGHNFYWTKGAGQGVVGTDTYTRPDINFRPLFEIK